MTGIQYTYEQCVSPPADRAGPRPTSRRRQPSPTRRVILGFGQKYFITQDSGAPLGRARLHLPVQNGRRLVHARAAASGTEHPQQHHVAARRFDVLLKKRSGSAGSAQIARCATYCAVTHRGRAGVRQLPGGAGSTSRGATTCRRLRPTSRPIARSARPGRKRKGRMGPGAEPRAPWFLLLGVEILLGHRAPRPDRRKSFFRQAMEELGKINSTVSLGQSHVVQLFKTKIDPSADEMWRGP